MKLLIVESPSKAKTIEKYLEGAYTVRASVGHVRDLPSSNKKAIDIEAGFVPHYEISKGKEKVVRELRALAESATEVLLATDPDREGEAISYHIQSLLLGDGTDIENLPTIPSDIGATVIAKKIKKTTRSVTAPIHRVTFNEITKEAVTEALKHPRDLDKNLIKAQEARRVLDRLVGYDLSGVIWKKVRYGLSAGRVQSPALRIIMEREREIRAFIPETYYVIGGEFQTQKKETLMLNCSIEPRDITVTQDILEKGKKGIWKVIDLKESEQKRSPRAPFTTSTLQQTASTRLGYSPSNTMRIAQKLYEKGFITYMRTDSTNLAGSAIAEITQTIEKKYGKEFVQVRTYKTKSKNAQEAHEAIRPTHAAQASAGTTDEEARLYKLIWERTVSSQMVDAKLLKTKIEASVDAKDFPTFSANGSRVLFPGWLSVDTGARGEDVELPEVKIGEVLKLVTLDSTEKQTQPPNRYSEAGLVKELEERGIGRPSTYASIMRTLEDRGYVTKEGKTLFPTDTGDVVSSFLEANFANYISDTFTAEMEDELDDIANGTREYVKTLTDFYGPFQKEVKEKDTLGKITTMGDAPAEFKCPICGKDMIVKLGKNGKFLSCSTYPDCAGARLFDGTELAPPKAIGKPCPKCGFNKKGELKAETGSGGGHLVIREGRFGTFISCSRYPKCKYIEQDPEEMKKKDSGVLCPMCKNANMVERRGRFGIFYSCGNYPECKNAIKAKPTGNICNLCGSLMMEGTKTIPERCSNKMCKMHNPHKLEKK
jgi:DNA topoisomerase-1